MNLWWHTNVCFTASATFFFDKRLNLIKENELKKENREFFDAIQTLSSESVKLFTLPQKIMKMFPQSRNPILLSNKAWDVLFSLSMYTFVL